ncbi:MAG: transporter [bacterium]
MVRTKLRYKILLFFIIAGCVSANVANAQLSTVFGKVFTDILADQLQRSGSPGQHGMHFIEAADLANSVLTPALNSLVANNVSSFPLSSTSAGVTFDFSTGQPVSITESLGPIFAETARTLGKGKINIGANFTYLSLSKFRGMDTNDIRFTFTHQDVTSDGTLGESPNESDTIDLNMDLDVNASIVALFATLGVTNSLDIGIAVPFINVSLSGTAQANVNSFTYAALGTANHNFGQDVNNPQLQTTSPYDESATGLGDIAFRLKYSFARGAGLDVAAFADLRLPTGDEDDFLGTGKTNFKISGVASKKIGDFTPHLNVAYDKRSAELDSDEFEFIFGFDQKVISGLTFAFDVLGEVDVNNDEVIELFPGTKTIVDRATNGQAIRKVDLSNIPERDNDNTYNASFGFRYAPSASVILLGNLLVPLNDGGLRSTVAPTVGLTISL